MYAIKNVTPANVFVILQSHTLCSLTSMLIAEVGEPPDIAESNGVAETGEEEVALVSPRAPLHLLLVLLYLSFAHVLSCDMFPVGPSHLLSEL